MGTRYNRLIDAVLMCIHDLCFRAKIRKYITFFSYENYRFYSREKSQYKHGRVFITNGQEKVQSLPKSSHRNQIGK